MPKRKRADPTTKRKPKKAEPKPDPEGDESPFFPVRAVLQERRKKGVFEYLVDWEPNPKTGEEYPPNWVRRAPSSFPPPVIL